MGEMEIFLYSPNLSLDNNLLPDFFFHSVSLARRKSLVDLLAAYTQKYTDKQEIN